MDIDTGVSKYSSLIYIYVLFRVILLGLNDI